MRMLISRIKMIADVYPDDTVRYRMLPTTGFRELGNNFL